MFRELFGRVWLLRRRSRRRPARPASRERRLLLEGLEERSLLSAVATVTTLSVSASSIKAGDPVTLSANVSAAYPNTGTPGDGSVVFEDGSTVLGTVPVVNGAASLTTDALPAGTALITAQYTGDVADYAPSANGVGPGSIVTTIAGGGTAAATAIPVLATTVGLSGVGPLAVDSAGDLFIGAAATGFTFLSPEDPCSAVMEVEAQTGDIQIVAGATSEAASSGAPPVAGVSLDDVGGLAADDAGNLFIADVGANVVYEVNLATETSTIIAGNGTAGFTGDGGQATAAELNGPATLACDGAGDLFVADAGNNRIRALNLASGVIRTVAGNGTAGDTGDGGPATAASIYTSFAADRRGHLFLADPAGTTIREVDLSTGLISTVATLPSENTPADWVSVIAVAPDGGHVFLTNGWQGMVEEPVVTPGGVADPISGAPANPSPSPPPPSLREVDLATGEVTTLVSQSLIPTGDGCAVSAATFNIPGGIAVDAGGNLFFGELFWSDDCLRKISTATEVDVESPQVTVTDFGQTCPSPDTHGLMMSTYDFAGPFAQANPGRTLEAIKITSLPSHGQFYGLSGANFYVGEVLSSPYAFLIYSPNAGYVGPDSFGWTGFDGTYWANGSANVNINVLRQPPSCENWWVTTVAGGPPLAFSPGDFSSRFSDNEPTASLQTVRITRLPYDGMLALAGQPVAVGQLIPVGDLGTLTYSPQPGDVVPDSFDWTGYDGTLWAATASVFFRVEQVTATSFSETVASGTTLAFSAGDFSANFSDATAALQEIEITQLPGNGSLALAGQPVSAGQTVSVAVLGALTYTPSPGFVGSDSFGWTATDADGLSAGNDAEVNIAVTPVPTVTTLSVSASSIKEGDFVTLSANVSAAYPSTGTPGDGSVVFMDGSTVLGTVPVFSNGAASLTTDALPAGTALITAAYTGDGGNFAPSTNVVGPDSLISTVLGGGATPVAPGVQVSDAAIGAPAAIAVDASGNLFFTDGNQVFEVGASGGAISLVAGNGTAGYSGDGLRATAAELSAPSGLAVDASGDLFIADTGNNCVRVVNLGTGAITTIAGNGTDGYSGDGGQATAAELNAPGAIALDGDGDLFVAAGVVPYDIPGRAYTGLEPPFRVAGDGDNHVRELNLGSGIITTIAGEAADDYSAAALGPVGAIAADDAGDVFLGDVNFGSISEVDLSSGAITWVGGATLDGSADGYGDVAGLAADSQGNLLIHVPGGNRLFSPSSDGFSPGVWDLDLATGNLTALAGGWTGGYAGDGGPADGSLLSLTPGPGAMAIDSAGDLFFVDAGNNCVREISPAAVVKVIAPPGFGLYAPQDSTFFLENSAATSFADNAFSYGPAGQNWLPIAGDWSGSGSATVGLYDPATSTFYLHDSNGTGNADLTFQFGPAGQPAAAQWIPIAGDWTGDGTVSVGLYDPASSTFYLKNSNAAGYADETFRYGSPGAGWVPIVGHWTGAAADSVGLFNPATSTFYLKNSNTAGYADETFNYGPGGLPAAAQWTPIAGDWTGCGTTTIGLYDPSTSLFYLKNTNTTGYADTTFAYGAAGAGWVPVVGAWVAAAPPQAAPPLQVGSPLEQFQPAMSSSAESTGGGQTAAIPAAPDPAATAQSLAPAVAAATQAAPPDDASDSAAAAGSGSELLALDADAVDQLDLGSLADQQLSGIAGLDDLATGGIA